MCRRTGSCVSPTCATIQAADESEANVAQAGQRSSRADEASVSQTEAPAAPAQLCNNDIMVPMITVASGLMSQIQEILHRPMEPVTQQTLSRLDEILKEVKPQLKALKRAAKHGSTGQAAAAGEQPSQDSDYDHAPAQHGPASHQGSEGAQSGNAVAAAPVGNRQTGAAAVATAGSAGASTGGGAEPHGAAALPDQAVAMELSALPNGEAASVAEEANRPAGPHNSVAPERRPAQATGNPLQEPPPGEHAVAAARHCPFQLLSLKTAEMTAHNGVPYHVFATCQTHGAQIYICGV